jgi:hypothetical protein
MLFRLVETIKFIFFKSKTINDFKSVPKMSIEYIYNKYILRTDQKLKMVLNVKHFANQDHRILYGHQMIFLFIVFKSVY